MKCIEDEIPFEVPEGWEWCRLGVLFNHNTGKALNKNNSTGTLLSYITTSNLYWNHFELDSIKGMYFSDTEIEKCTVNKGDLLVCEGGDIGRAAIWNYDYDIRIQNHIHKLRPFTNISVELYYHIFYYYKLCGMINGKGIGIQGLSSNQLHSIPMPLPSLSEQYRIVEKLNELLSFVDTIESNKTTLQDLIKQTKSKILDLAIRGKLVPQNLNDEPTSVLLERIRVEKEELIKQGKIKRDKKESIIFRGDDNSYYEKIKNEVHCIDSELPFKLPVGWAYERLGNICSVARGGSPRPIEDYLTDDENGLNWIKISDTKQGGKYIFSTKEKIRREGLSKTRLVKCGDFLLTNSMSFGRPYILQTNGCIHDGWLVIGDTESVFQQEFLYYLLSSTTMFNTLNSLAVGSTVKNLKSESVKSLIVPIPPLQEQAAIAQYIETIFDAIFPIEKSLK